MQQSSGINRLLTDGLEKRNNPPMRNAFLCSLLAVLLISTASAVEPPGVVINEVMYDTGSGDPRDEFIELYNNSTAAVELQGWHFSKGVTFIFPQYTLNAGAYIVV